MCAFVVELRVSVHVSRQFCALRVHRSVHDIACICLLYCARNVLIGHPNVLPMAQCAYWHMYSEPTNVCSGHCDAIQVLNGIV